MPFPSSNPAKEFKRLVVGANIVTPNVLSYGFTADGEHVFEIASGSGISDEPLFGISIRDTEGEAAGGKLCDTEAECLTYLHRWEGEQQRQEQERQSFPL